MFENDILVLSNRDPIRDTNLPHDLDNLSVRLILLYEGEDMLLVLKV
jgi:hypothetical protein